MILKIHMHGRQPWEKEIETPEDLVLDHKDPPPDGHACIYGIELEGHYQTVPSGYFNKTTMDRVSLDLGVGVFDMIRGTVAAELSTIKNAPFEDLPLMMEKVTTESGKRAWADRMQTGK